MYSGLVPVPDQDQSNLIGPDSFYDPSIHDPLGHMPEENALKLKLSVSEYNSKRFKYLIKTKQIHKVEEIALDNEFLGDNSEYVHSGELPYLALEGNELDLLDKLLEAGFNFPTKMFIKVITERNNKLVQTIINMNLYSMNSLLLTFWTLIKHEMFDEAEMFMNKETDVKDFFFQYDLRSPLSIEQFLNSQSVLEKVLINALNLNEDLIACEILVKNPMLINSTIVLKACENICIETMKVIWSGNLILPSQVTYKRAVKSPIWENLNLSTLDRSDRKKINRLMRITVILNTLLKQGKISDAEKVLDWPQSCNEAGILNVLISYEQPDLILKHIENTEIDITGSEFLMAFEKEYYKACIQMLRFKDPRGILAQRETQEKLINLLDSGTTCLEAIQMLSYINYRDWVTDLAVDLCEHLDTLINESDELIACSSPVLFCVLVAEFLYSISQNSEQNKHRCLECSESFVSQVIHLKNATKDTEVLKFMLMERDCKGRSSLVIMSENNMLELLDGVDVGAIVSKMWKGPDADNLWDASRLVNGIVGDNFLEPVSLTTPYRFAFSVWVETCSIRSFTGSISVILLLFVYNALIIQGIKYKNFIDLASETSTQSLLRLSQILIIGLMCDLAMQYYFCMKTNRAFNFDAMRILDVVIFGQMLLILAGLQDNMGPGKDYPDTDPEIFVGLIHSFENLFVWIRVLLMLITTKRLGPFLFMIYHIMQKMISFYFLFACFSIWFAAVFTALFSSSLPDNYGSFWISMRTLYSSSLGGFDFSVFATTNKQVFGALLLGLYLIITNIILLNLFIALFTTIYQQVIDQVESTYRSAVIVNYEKWRWDYKYGNLILYSTPFSAFAVFCIPFYITKRDPTAFNQGFGKYFYASIYGVVQMVILLIIDLVCAPFVYLYGFVQYPRTSADSIVDNENVLSSSVKVYNWKRLIIWTFFGLFIVFYHIVQDMITFWRIIPREYKENVYIHPFVTEFNIKVLKETLKNIKEDYVSHEEVANLWAYIKTLMNCQPESPQDLANALDYCVFFTQSSKDPRINVRLMERIIENIDEKDLEKFSNIRVPYVNKGISNFRNLLGGIEVNGTLLPKRIGNPGGPVDIHNMASTFKLMQQMEGQIDYFSEVLKGLKERGMVTS